MYKPKHFKLHEYLPPDLYKFLADRNMLSAGWSLLDDRLLRTDDQLREKFGKIKINDWHWGGIRLWSGLRTPDSPYYSLTSQHTFGRGSDKLFLEADVNTVRQYVLDNPEEFPHLNSLEMGTDWLHSDTRNCDRIMTYWPL